MKLIQTVDYAERTLNRVFNPDSKHHKEYLLLKEHFATYKRPPACNLNHEKHLFRTGRKITSWFQRAELNCLKIAMTMLYKDAGFRVDKRFPLYLEL